jgi:predicted DsbA family dithiol-disulfide isomerase
VRIDIWSDVACPWCYIGKRRFETALARFEHRADVQVRWHSFQLDPQAQSQPAGAHATMLASKYGMSAAQAQQSLDTMRETGAADGVDFRFDLARSGNTFDAHRLLQLAADRGVQPAVKERLMRAYFSEGEDVSDRETLVRLGGDAGLASDEVRDTLASPRYSAEVQADVDQARQLGISGVPFFVLDAKFGVSGAQPTDVFSQALQQAWDEQEPLTILSDTDAACDVESGSC